MGEPSSTSAPRAAAVIVAAGNATRMGDVGVRKPLLELGGRPLVELACAAFDACAAVAEIVIVAHADDVEAIEALRTRPAFAKLGRVVPGGEERADSVRIGCRAVAGSVELVAVHDGARPLVSSALIGRALETAAREGAALPALAVADTLKESLDGRSASATVDRSRLWAAQTPQCFALDRFLELLARADDEGFRPTDDAALWERYVGPVPLVEGEATNRKVTTQDDLTALRAAVTANTEGRAMELRIGNGFDLHRLVAGRRCVLGGIELPHDRGPEGHSDGDAVLHAITDAVLGAAGLDDIGTLFPDDDERWRHADSKRLLRTALQRVAEAGFHVVNVDVVIATEGPRIAPHRRAMREAIAEVLGVEPGRVNLKGKTLEGMGALAGGAGVAVQAACLLRESP